MSPHPSPVMCLSSFHSRLASITHHLLIDAFRPKFDIPDPEEKKKRKREALERSIQPTAASSRFAKRSAALKGVQILIIISFMRCI